MARAKHVLSDAEGHASKNSKPEIRNSKQSQMTKIVKSQTSFIRIRVSDFPTEIFLSQRLFRISIFGFRICLAGCLARANFLKWFYQTVKHFQRKSLKEAEWSRCLQSLNLEQILSTYAAQPYCWLYMSLPLSLKSAKSISLTRVRA